MRSLLLVPDKFFPLVLVLFLVPSLPASESTPSSFIKGVTVSCQTYGWEWATPEMSRTLDELKSLGVNSIAIHPYAQIREDGHSAFAITARCRSLRRFENVQKMVWNGLAVSSWRFSCADVEAAIELCGIASDHFPGKFVGQKNAERGLTGSRRTNDGHERGKRHHRKRICQPRATNITRTIVARRMLPRTC